MMHINQGRQGARRLLRFPCLLGLLLAGACHASPAGARPVAGATSCPRSARTFQALPKQVLAGMDVQGPPLLDEASGHLFLTDAYPGLVWMFDACTGALLHTATLGPVLYGSALDGRRHRLFVAWTSQSPAYTTTAVAMLDTRTGNVLRTIAIPRAAGHIYQPHLVAVDSVSGWVWVLSRCSQLNPATVEQPCTASVSLYDPDTGRLRQVTSASEFDSLVVDEPTKRLFLLSQGSLSMLDGRTGRLLQSLPAQPGSTITVDQSTGRVYVLGLYQITVLDGRTGAPITSIAGAQAAVIDHTHRRLIVACDPTEISPICQYELRTERLLLRSTSPDHFVVRAVDEADGLLLGLSSTTGRAGVIDERTGKVLWAPRVSTTPRAETGSYSLTSATFDPLTGRAFVLDNPAATDPTAGQVNTLIVLAIPKHPGTS